MKLLANIILFLFYPVLRLIGDFGLSTFNVDLPDGFYEDLTADLNPCDVILTNTPMELSNLFNIGRWNHAALYIGLIDGIPTIREAVGKGVVERSLYDFLKNKNELALYRLRNYSLHFEDSILNNSSLMLGLKYNWLFKWKSRFRVYCSQYIYRCFNQIRFLTTRKIMGITFYKPDDIARDPMFEKIREHRY